MSRRFAILDRDGTINEEVGYVLHPADMRLMPGSAEAIHRLRELGLGVVVVTNQSPIGRGLLTEQRLGDIHDRLRGLLADEGATVDRIEVCPHTPEDGCACRKPGIEMAERAARLLDFDPSEAFVIGDHAGDMRLGRALGATTILVLTGHGAEECEGAAPFADHIADDLLGTARIIESLLPDGPNR
ncbi:MAG: D-glycero-alpha-D-manno-heptose-1,7-bisphosphate 7-phosphatase [Actinomycetota bacterium]